MDKSILFALLVFFSAILVVRPTADIPINDDWQYSHVTRKLLETGRVIIDVGIAPALVGQAVLGAAYSRVVGFSHSKLRALTWLWAAVFLCIINAILKLSNVSPQVRTLSLITIALNPIFFHLANSFMTELYGFTPMFFGVWLWLKGGLYRQWVASLIIGSTFWVRQFCVLAWPALVFWEFYAERSPWQEKLPRVIALSAFFITPIVSYLIWVRASGNVTEAFESPLGWLMRFNSVPLFYHPPVALLYLVLFSLPLVSLTFQRPSKRGLILSGSWMVGALGYFYSQGVPLPEPDEPLHKFFPYLGNIINPFGIGPVTLTDLYLGNELPEAPALFWVGLFTAGISVTWISGIRRPFEGKFSRFFWAYAALSFYIVVMAYRKDVFERYYFGLWIVLLLWLAPKIEIRACSVAWISAWGLVLLTSALTVMGTHDYFRWQEARWELVRRADSLGIPYSQLDGGFEVNGWLQSLNGWTPDCGVAEHFFCSKRRFAIKATESASDIVLESLSPRQWLFPIRLLLVERRF